MEKITSKNNQLIKDTKKLFTYTKARKDNGVFVLEGANITIFSKQIKSKEITELLFNEKNIQLIMKEIVASSLNEIITNDFFLVIAATDNESLNSDIVKICNEKNILVNNITSTYDMNTRFCSVLSNENYKIGISANGDPKKSLSLKENLANFLKNKR